MPGGWRRCICERAFFGYRLNNEAVTIAAVISAACPVALRGAPVGNMFDHRIGCFCSSASQAMPGLQKNDVHIFLGYLAWPHSG
jgi:hypothetical protein